MKTHFLNLDLLIYSQEDLSILYDELKDKAFVLHNDRITEKDKQYYRLCIEADCDYSERTDASNFLTLHLCEIINSLSARSQDI